MSDAETLSIPDPNARLRVGTLQYTKVGLVWLFVMILWGDFCFTLMESVAPDILPFRFKDLHGSDLMISVILGSIPNAINVMLNPIISTASDRHRGRFGRRIPFLLFSTPFICGALVLLAFSNDLGLSLQTHLGAQMGWSKVGTILLVTAVMWILFSVLNMFAGTTYYYLFNDVVPHMYLGRFAAMFRLVYYAAYAMWSLFLFPHGLTHMKLIFLIGAGVYFAGFMVMCLGIKEGKYPTPDSMGPGFWAKFLTYAKECLCHRFYIYWFGLHLFWRLSWACQIFVPLMRRDSLGLTLKQIGIVNTGVMIVSAILAYPAGMLSDRYHPMRVMLWVQCGLVVIVPLDFIWVIWHRLPPQTNFYLLIVLSAIQLPLGAVFDIAGMPCSMRIIPRSRYGQFASFDATIMSLFMICAIAASGLFMTWMRNSFPDAVYGANFCYRLMPFWRLPFLAIALTFLFLLYREWKKLGGMDHYVPPGFPNEAAMEAPAALAKPAAAEDASAQ